MESVVIIPVKTMPAAQRQACLDAQLEAGRLWNDCVAFHKEWRGQGKSFPKRKEFHAFTKGNYALHSQTIQQIYQQLIGNVDATLSRRKAEPGSRSWLKLPWREKRFYPLYWPAQAVCYDPEAKRLILPMGRGRKSLVFKIELDFEPGAAKLIWNDGYELHLVRSVPDQYGPVGPHTAGIDLGEIHLATVATSSGAALIATGRGIRSDKRLLAKQLGQLARHRSRCIKG